MSPERGFGSTLTMPPAGALSCRFLRPCSARRRSKSAFSRLCRLPDTSASAPVLSDLIFSASSSSFWSASSTMSFACSFSILETVSPFVTSSLARCRSYFAFISAVEFCSSVMRACAVRLLDLGVGLLELRLLLLHGPLQRGPVELDDDVPRLDDRAALHQLDDLQLAGIHRRGEHDRLERPDLAADFQRVDELPGDDLRGREVGQRPATRGDEQADDGDGDDDAGDHDVAWPSHDCRQALHHDPARLPTLRATTAPSSRPAVMTASWAFVVPTVTARSS